MPAQSQHTEQRKPLVIRILCRLVESAYDDHTRLASWHDLKGGQRDPLYYRNRRSEAREALVCVLVFLIEHWFEIESLQCAAPSGPYERMQGDAYIAQKVSEEWEMPVSVYRVRRVFRDLRKVGYLTSTQRRYRRKDGNWSGFPAQRTFTKTFFIELGGKGLWKWLLKNGCVAPDQIEPEAK